MLKDLNANQIGYIIPHKIAIDYRNLVVNLVPALEDKIRIQDEQVKKQNLIINKQDEEIQLLNSNISDERQKYGKLEGLCKMYEKELKWKKFWKTTSIIFAGTTTVLLITTIAK